MREDAKAQREIRGKNFTTELHGGFIGIHYCTIWRKSLYVPALFFLLKIYVVYKELCAIALENLIFLGLILTNFNEWYINN